LTQVATLEGKGKIMKKLLTGLSLGAAMLVGVSAAQAEPLLLVGVQMDQVTAGGYFKNRGTSLAWADAKATAWGGKNNVASTYTSATAAPGFASANSSSFACSGSHC
jgi:hypothetical protein